MKQDRWDSMSNLEKYEYLSGYSPEVEKQNALNGKAKPGDNDAIVTVYKVTRGEVSTGYAYTLYEAAKMDHECLLGLQEQTK